jgi:hypothetical protein
MLFTRRRACIIPRVTRRVDAELIIFSGQCDLCATTNDIRLYTYLMTCVHYFSNYLLHSTNYVRQVSASVESIEISLYKYNFESKRMPRARSMAHCCDDPMIRAEHTTPCASHFNYSLVMEDLQLFATSIGHVSPRSVFRDAPVDSIC